MIDMTIHILQARIATLEAELAASREDAKLAWAEASMGPTEAAITHELAQSQAHANALRDALENAAVTLRKNDLPHHAQVIVNILAQTPAASLAAHDAPLLAEVDALRAALAAAEARIEHIRREWQSDADRMNTALADERRHADALALRGKLLRDAAHSVLGWVEGHAHVEEDEIELEVQRWDEFASKHAARRAAEADRD